MRQRKRASLGRLLTFEAPLERSTNRLWGSHVRVPANIVTGLSVGPSRRVTCRLNDSEPFQCALLPIGSGQFVISVNKRLRMELGLQLGGLIRVGLERDASAYGLPMPEELSELLAQDREGNALFHALPRGKQRTLLYIVGSVKDPSRRLRRAIVIVRHLKANGGRIHYRQLAAALRNPHQTVSGRRRR